MTQLNNRSSGWGGCFIVVVVVVIIIIIIECWRRRWRWRRWRRRRPAVLGGELEKEDVLAPDVVAQEGIDLRHPGRVVLGALKEHHELLPHRH